MKFKSVDDIQYIVGVNIRKKCIADKVNMMKLSEEIDMSYEYLRNIVSLNGRKNLSFYSMYKIACMLDMSMDEMCMGIFDNETNNKKSIVRS
jgi:hypothetical protein